MAKMKELQKKRERIEKEVIKAKEAYKKQGQTVKDKQAALDQIEKEILSQLLIENKMNMTDLMAMLEDKTTDPSVNKSFEEQKEDATTIGGVSHEV